MSSSLLTIDILKLSVYGLEHMKSINYYEKLYDILVKNNRVNASTSINTFLENNEIKFHINDNLDVMLKIDDIYLFEGGWSKIMVSSMKMKQEYST